MAPAVLLASNDSFGFDAPGLLDSFVYLGYFWHYPEHLWIFDDNSNYKVSRLPWILPGYIAHSLLGTIGAVYLLSYLTLALGAVAIYLLIRDSLHNRPVAAVVGVAWACCTWVHGVGGWSYHVTMAANYYLMACWLAVRAARRPGGAVSATLAGAFLAAAVHTHLFLAVFVPLVVILYWAARPPTAATPFASSLRLASFGLGGAALLTLALVVVNGATGGAWAFFLPQIEQSLKLSGTDRWWLGETQWVASARYLVIPVVFMVGALAVPFYRRPDFDRRVAIAWVATAWAAFAVMCFFQFIPDVTTLDYPYMAFPIFAHAFPCVGALLAGASVGDRRLSALAVAMSASIMLATLLLLLPSPLPGWMDAIAALGFAEVAPVVPPLAVGLAGAALAALVKGPWRLVVFAMSFSVVNAWIAPSPTSYGVGTPGYRQSMVSLFRDADRFTTALDPTLRGIKYWWPVEHVTTPEGVAPTAPIFDSFVATRAWLVNLLGRRSPGLPIDQLTLAHLDRGECIGLLSLIDTQARIRAAMASHFAALGRPLYEVAARRFVSPELSFGLTILKPSRPAPGPAARGTAPPPCTFQ